MIQDPYSYVTMPDTNIFSHGEQLQNVQLMNPQPFRRAVLLVCRQIYNETANLPCALTVCFDSFYAFCQPKTWHTSLRSAIKVVHLTIPLSSSDEIGYFVEQVLNTDGPPLGPLPSLKSIEIQFVSLNRLRRVLMVRLLDRTVIFTDWLDGLNGRQSKFEVVTRWFPDVGL